MFVVTKNPNDMAGWMLFGGIVGGAAGLVIGGTQSVLLRRVIARPGWWLLTTVLLWGIAAATGYGALSESNLLYLLVLLVVQWLLLRQRFSRALWWIPASIAGVFAGWATFVFTSNLLNLQTPDIFAALAALGLLFGIPYGVITGFTLMKLHPR